MSNSVTTLTPSIGSQLRRFKGALVTGAMTLPAVVMAAVPSEIQTAQTDAVDIAKALLVLAIVVWAALYAKRFFGGR